MAELAALNVKINGDASGLQGALNVAEGGLERVGVQAAQTQRQVAATSGGMGRLGQVFKNNGFAISNAANQFSDLAVQMSMGVPATRALSQQLPQMTAFMGPLATIIGVTSGVLIGLAGNFFAASKSGKTLEEVLDDLNSSVDGANDKFNNLNDSLAGLVGIGGTYAQRALEIAQAQREIAFYDAAGALRETVDAVADLGKLNTFAVTAQNMRDMQASLTDASDPEVLQGFIEQYQATLSEMAEGMGLSVEAADTLSQSLITLANSQSVTDITEAAHGAALAFLEAHGSVAAMTEDQRRIYASLVQTQQAAERLKAIEEGRSAVIAETERELDNQITLLGMINQFGEDSVEVERMRRKLAREEYENRLKLRGITGDELDDLMAKYTLQENLTAEAKKTSDAIAEVQSANLGSFQAQVNMLAHTLGIAADEAKRILTNLPVGMNFGDFGALSGMSGGQLIFGGQPGDIPEDENTNTNASSLANQIERDLEQLREGFMSQEELQIAAYESQQEILQQALDRRLITQQEYNSLMEDAQKQHQDHMAAIDAYRHGTGVQQAQQFMGDMATALRNGNDKMANISRVFAAGETLINAWRAYSQTLADPTLPFFAKIPAALSVLSAGMGAVNAIRGMGGGGGSGGASAASGAASAASAAPARSSSNVAINLTGGDMFSRDQVIGLINAINEAQEDGAVVRLV